MPEEPCNADELHKSEELLEAIRHIVTDSLQRGIPAPVVAGLLTYVAAEMSLQLAPSPLQAVPVLLDAISKASQAHDTHAPVTPEDVVLDGAIPAERTVH